MTEDKRIKWKTGIILVCSAFLSLVLTRSIIKDIGSLGLFTPVEKKVDFKMTDIYNAVEENRAEIPLSQDVIIVSVDECNRNETLDVIRQIASYAPKAIGLDVYFAVPQENNNYLLETVLLTENLVSAMQIATQDGGKTFERVPLSFYDEDYPPEHAGFVNLDVIHTWNVIRTFRPYVCTSAGDTLPSMPMALAEIAYPEQAAKVFSKGNTKEIIDYTGCEIEVLTAHQLNDDGIAERIKGKVVLIGLMNDVKDIYLTPLRNPLAGIMIHAHALQTIISDSFIRNCPAWINKTFAVLLSILFLYLLQVTKNHRNYFGSLIVRISQFVILYLLLWCGCWIFAKWHIYVDFAPAILMLGLSSLARDLIASTYGIITNIVISHRNKQ